MNRILIACVAAMAIAGCTPKTNVVPLDCSNYCDTIGGKAVQLYRLSNANGMMCEMINYGGRVVSLWVPDRDGHFEDVSIGYSTTAEYVSGLDRYYGATIGRYGNRIGNAQFVLNGDTISLNANENGNTLHGGKQGFCEQVMDAEMIGTNAVEFHYVSADGEQGFPGTVDARIRYTLTDDNELKCEYFATTDKPTVVNLTNHTYFNLKGEGNGSINDHIISINADRFTVIDSVLIPTGELRDVEGTPMDFRTPKAIGADIDADYEQLRLAGGYDHNWVLCEATEGYTLAAKVTEPESGRTLEVLTNEPGLQFYGGNFMAGKETGKRGRILGYREAFCLETQHFPDSPNHADFPSTVLNPGDKYYSICIYRFGIEK